MGACALVLAAVVFRAGLWAHLRDLNVDYSFYYLGIARNFAHGLFSTFDGVNVTNGYHPLWALLLIPVHWLAQDGETALRLAKSLEFVLIGLASFLFFRAARCAGWSRPLALVPVMYLLTMRVFTEGVETTPQTLLLFALLFVLVRSAEDPMRRSYWRLLVAVVALLPWARLDAAAIGAAVAALLTIGFLRIPEAMRGYIGWAWAGLCASLAAYAALSLHFFGVAAPVSGLLRLVWSSRLFDRAGGFHWWQNLLDHAGLEKQRVAAVAVMLLAVAASWSIRAYREPKYRIEHAFDAFVVCLAAGYLARLLYASVFLHVELASPRHYLPGDVLKMLWPLLFHRLVLVWSMRGPRAGRRFVPAAVGVAALCVAVATHAPWKRLQAWGERDPVDWTIADHEAAEWMNRHLPPGSVIASPDAGVLGYFLDHRIINSDGLVGSVDFYRAVRQHAVDAWLMDAGVTHLAGLVPEADPDGCRHIAAASGQPGGFSGSCVLLHEGRRFTTDGPEPWRIRVFRFER